MNNHSSPAIVILSLKKILPALNALATKVLNRQEGGMKSCDGGISYVENLWFRLAIRIAGLCNSRRINSFNQTPMKA
jgi:hypothetical protein